MKNKDLAYKYKIDKDQAFLYANSKCKHCNGKGYITTQVPSIGKSIRNGLPNAQSISYCSCFYKKKKKFS